MCGLERESDPGSTFPRHFNDVFHDSICGTGEDLESYLSCFWGDGKGIPTLLLLNGKPHSMTPDFPNVQITVTSTPKVWTVSVNLVSEFWYKCKRNFKIELQIFTSRSIFFLKYYWDIYLDWLMWSILEVGRSELCPRNNTNSSLLGNAWGWRSFPLLFCFIFLFGLVPPVTSAAEYRMAD